MNLWKIFFNSKSSDISTNCEPTHEVNLAVKWVDSCEACLEDGSNDHEVQFQNETDPHANDAKSSFLHSVANMIGMLIGVGFPFQFLLFLVKQSSIDLS